MIRSIVGQCHVGWSNRRVIREIRSRMKRGAWKALPRETCRRIMRDAIRCHDTNRGLYAHVMSGGQGFPFASRQ
jgi:hypothetical protein